MADPKPLWRPAGWAPIESDLPRTETEARDRHIRETKTGPSQLRKARNKARHRDQNYDPAAKLRENERLVKQMSGPARDRKTGKALRVPDPRYMTEAELIAYAQVLAEEHKYDWKANRRPQQAQPKDYETWLLLAGRGFGKSRTGSETVREWAIEEFPGGRFAVVARDHKTLRDVCFEGECGLTKVIPQKFWNPKDYKRGLGDVSLLLKNGSLIQGFTAHEPDALRGPAFDGFWGDEFAAWSKSTAQEVIDMFWMTSRENENARCVLTTTPKRIKHVQDMIKRAEDPTEKIVITRGKTADNTALPKKALDRLYRMFGGTRQGRQELDGELVLDLDLALWTGEMIDHARWRPDPNAKDDGPPKMNGCITGVDPSGSDDGDATGIVTVGWTLPDQVIWVLENRTCNGGPAERYQEACRSAYRHGSIEIWYESAYGGDNCKFGIETSWKYLQETGEIPKDAKPPMIRPSTIKGDKSARAMPVAAMYEQQVNTGRVRVWHLEPTIDDPETGFVGNNLASLEEEMLTWETGKAPGTTGPKPKSPNGIDALVHATRQIMRRIGLETTIAKASPRKRINKGWQSPASRR